MNSQFKRGIIEMCVLKMISREDMYGFQLIESISKEVEVNENTVYPILRRLTKQGLFDTYSKSMSVGAPRKYYSLTDTGEDKLSEYELEWRKFLDGVYRILGGSNNEE